MAESMSYFWLIHIVIGLLIPLMLYCDRCGMEEKAEKKDELDLTEGR